MAIKTYQEFLNENLFGAYSYYGAGSLIPIVHKLATEGKSAQQIYSYLTTLGVDEERKRRAISKVFLNESEDLSFLDEGLFEDDIDKALDDLKKDDKSTEVKSDDTKSGEDDEESKEDEPKAKSDDKTESDKIAALQSALKDAEKLEKIKKILGETFEMDFSEETDVEYINGIFDYPTLMEKLSKEVRDKLKDTDFVFADTRSWPIHDEKHAKTALVWATWPQYKDKKAAIVKAVIKKYPHLKGVGAAK
jgi:hypothetical protein